jgi:hypothetical protein
VGAGLTRRRGPGGGGAHPGGGARAGAGPGRARWPPALARRAHLGMEQAQSGAGRPSAVAGLGPGRSRTAPPPPGQDLAALLGPGTRVCFRSLGGACSAPLQERGGIGQWVGQHESCQVQGLFL